MRGRLKSPQMGLLTPKQATQLLHPLPRYVLVNIEIAGRLHYRDTALANEPNRLDLELSTETPCLHTPPPASL